MKKIRILLAEIFLFLGSGALCAEYYVDASRADDSGAATSWATAKQTIQAAVDLTAAGDTVWVTNGTYDVGGTVAPGSTLTNRVCVTNAITVCSVNGANVTVIQGASDNGGYGSAAVRCVYLTSGTVEGFTLQGGHTANWINVYGGGAWLSGDAALNNCILTGNSAYSSGGGAYCLDTAVVNNSTLCNNTAYDVGGGAYCAGAAVLNDSILCSNTAYSAGGVYCKGTATLNNCTLSGNYSSGYGGGATCDGASKLNNCVLYGNSAYRGGGGILSYAITLNNCLLAGNSAGTYGGGGVMSYGTTLNNCTLSSNTASAKGGGVCFSSSGNTLNNCIIWSNTAANLYYNSGSTAQIRYSCSDSLPSGEGNVSSDPLFADAVNGNFRLQGSSPCINAGSNVYVVGPTDLAGNPRIVTDIVDMGAYEQSPELVITAVTPSSGAVTNQADFSVQLSYTNAMGGLNTNSSIMIVSNSSTAVSGDWTIASNLLTFVPSNSWVDGDYSIYAKLQDNAGRTSQVFTSTFSVDLTPSVTNYYVDASRPDDTGVATNWATAKQTIQAAVDLTTAGDTVWVTNGTYNTGGVAAPGFALTNRVTVTNTITVQSVNGPESTIIQGIASGESAVRCAYLSSGAVMRGFTLLEGGTQTSGEDEDLVGGGAWCIGNVTLSNCTFRSNEAWFDGGGVYYYNDSTNAELTLSGCTFTSNSADYSGAISYNNYGVDSRLTLSNCTFRSNEAWSDGGGLYCYNDYVASGSLMTLSDSVFDVNTAGNGGGIYCYNEDSGANLALIGCTFSSNSAYSGGGLYYERSYGDDSKLTLSGCTFGSNNADNLGGGFYYEHSYGNHSELTLSDCTFSSNNAHSGGGFDCYNYGIDTVLTLSSCVFSSNSVGDSGGGINYANYDDTGTTILSNCTFNSNSAGDSGGGFCCAGSYGDDIRLTLSGCAFNLNSADDGGGIFCYGDMELNNCAFSSNVARENGGGLVCWPASVVVFNNCLLARNSAFYAGGLEASGTILNNCTVAENSTEYSDSGYAGAGIYFSGGTTSALNNCVIWGNTTGQEANNFTDGSGTTVIRYTCLDPLPSGEGNINANPGFVDAASGDFRLKNWSPCINAGTNDYVAEGLLGLDGETRIQDGMVDMGAYEQSAGWITILNVSPADGALTNHPDVAVTFQTVEGVLDMAHSAVFVSNSISAVEGEWSATTDQLTFTPANEWQSGNYRVWLQLQNSTGQTSDVFNSIFTIDVSPPVAPVVTNNYRMITEGINDLGYYPVVTLYGTNDPGSIVWLNDIQAQQISSNAWKLDFVAAGGITTNSLYATDAVGNRSETNLIVFSVAPYDVLMTNSFALETTNLSYNGQSLIISGSNTTATMTGAHSFSNLYVLNGAKITHEVGNTNGLQLTVSDTLYISTNSSIDATGCGLEHLGAGQSGGSYGGRGWKGINDQLSVNVYGSYSEPVDLGSGGYGTRGGGRIQIDTDSLILDGEIVADGESGSANGGGSGGSIRLGANTLSGLGDIRSDGAGTDNIYYGPGGGGRVAIKYAQTNNFNFNIQISCIGGAVSTDWYGGAGSIYTKKNGDSTGLLCIDGKLSSPNTEKCAGYEIAGTVSDEVVVRNTVLVLTNTTAFSDWTGSNSIVVQNGALNIGSGDNMVVDGWIWECNFVQMWDNITVTNGGKITHEAGNTNGLRLIVSDTLYVASDSSIDVTGKGDLRTSLADDYAGGSHGGRGGQTPPSTLAGPIYGDYAQPTKLGEGGNVPRGGGRIMLSTSNLMLNGSIIANGGSKKSWTESGGAGGSIWLQTTNIFSGGESSIRANGGQPGDYYSRPRGGGGGRIAIYYSGNANFNDVSCVGDGGGEPGSIYIIGSGAPVVAPMVTNFSVTATNNVTNTTLTFQGTKGINTSIWANWQQIASNSAATTWSGSVTLTQGVNQVQVYARDTAGNCSEVSNLTFFVDSIAPVAGTMVPANGSTNNSPFSELTISYTETGSGLDEFTTRSTLFVRSQDTNGVIQTLNGEWVVTTNTLTFFPQPIPSNQIYTVMVNGTLFDTFGNATPFSRSFGVDLVDPNPPTVIYTAETPISRQTLSGTKDTGSALYMNGALIKTNSAATDWSHEVSLTNGSNSFSFKVQDVAGNFSASTNITITYTDYAPGPVTNLMAITNGIGTEITLSWTNYSEYANGADISKYRVYQATNSFTDTMQAEKCFTNNAGIQSLLVTGLVRSVTNWYAVVPEDTAGKQQTNNLSSFGFAPNDTVPPASPAPITFACDTNSLTLSWPMINDIHNDFSTYRVYPTNSVVAVETTNNTFTLNGLAPSSNYHFGVSSKDLTGNESGRTSTNGYTLFSANPTATVVSVYSGRATIQWAPVSPTNNLLKYAVYTSTNWFTNVTGMTPVQNAFTTGTNQTVAGLFDNATNWIAVTAINKSGGELKTVTPVSTMPLPDTEGPELSGLKWNNAAITGDLTAPGTFSITASDPAKMNRVDFFINGELIGSQSGSGPSYSAFWNVAATPGDGIYTLSITAYDSHNNSSGLTNHVDVTLAPPSAAPTITSPAEGSAFNVSNVIFSGTASIYADSVVFSNATVVLGSAAIGSGGTFSKTLTLNEGTNIIYAAAHNRAGTGSPVIRTVVVNTGIPNAPFNLKAAARADGVIRLDWWEPQGVKVKEYVIYRATHSFTTTNEATRISTTSSSTYFDGTSTNTTFYYRVSDRNTAGTESALSDIASATADDQPPTAAISYASTGQFAFNGNTPVFAAGTVTVQVQTDEELLTVPFFNIVRDGGLPILVDLKKQSVTNYIGSFTVDSGMSSGTGTVLFACSDKVGNETDVLFPTNRIVFDTRGPEIKSLSITPASPIRNTNSVEVSVSGELSELPASRTSFGYRLSVTHTNLTLLSAVPFNGTGFGPYYFNLPPDAGSSNTAEKLSFELVSTDDLGNSCTSSWPAAQIYQGNLEPLTAPSNFTGTALPRGVIKLSWDPVDDAAGYHLLSWANGAQATNDWGTLTDTVYTNTFSDGTNWFGLKTIRTANGQTAESDSTTISVVADSVAPGAPTNLTITAAGNGMYLTWELSDTNGTASCSLYRSIEETTNYARILSNIPGTNVVDPHPLKGRTYYRATALDSVGNESGYSEAVSCNLSLVPVDSLTVTKTESDWPVVTWTHPESGAILGYNLYLDHNTNSPANSSLIPVGTPSFTDSGYDASSNRSYTVRAKDTQNESLGRTLELPLLSAVPDSGNRIDRGVMNRLTYRIYNDGTETVSNVWMDAVVNGIRHQSSQAVAVPSGGYMDVSLAVGGYTNLPDSAIVTNTVLITPNAGEEVRIQAAENYSVGDDILSAELLTGSFTRGSTGAVQFVLHNTCRETVEVLTAKNNGAADSPDIRFKLLDDSGNVYANQSFRQTSGVTNRANGGGIVTLQPGDSFTFSPVQINIPSSAPDQLTVKLELDHLYYGYSYTNQIAIGGLSATHKVNLLETPYYAVITNITPEVAVGTHVLLQGQTVSRGTEMPIGNQPLKLILSCNGAERSIDLYSDLYGNWQYTFTPAAGDGGTFLVYAIHPAMTDRSGPRSFQVLSVKISPTYARLSSRCNRKTDVYADITPVAGLTLTNLNFEVTGLPAGITVETNVPIATVAGGTTQRITCGITADTNWAGLSTQIVLNVQSDGNVWGTLTLDAEFGDATADVPVIQWTPNALETGVAVSNRTDEEIVFKNIGYADVSNAVLRFTPELPRWIYLNGATNLGTFAVGATGRLGFTVMPTNDIGAGTNVFSLSLEGSGYTSSVPVVIYVDNSGTGGASFWVGDIYTGWGTNTLAENYNGLKGARIQLTREDSAIVSITNVTTDANGSARLDNLPTGRYRVRVSAANHEDLTDRIWIKPGVTELHSYMLQTPTVTVEWNVTEVEVEDRYNIVLSATYKTDVPAPVIVIDPPSLTASDMSPGDIFNGEFTVKNSGLIRAENIHVTVPATDAYYKYELTGELPDTLEAQQSARASYRITCLSSLTGGSGGCYWYKPCWDLGYKYHCVNGTEFSNRVYFCWALLICDSASGSSGGSTPVYSNGGGGSAVNTGGNPSPTVIPSSEPGCMPPPPPPKCPPAQSPTGNGSDGSSGGGNAGAEFLSPGGQTAAAGSSVINLLSGAFQEGLQDISVKIPGGYLAFTRLYQDEQWNFNNPWNALSLTNVINARGAGSPAWTDATIERNGAKYKCLDQDGVHYGYAQSDDDGAVSYPYTITRTDAGWQWRNTRGEWIDYDASGAIQSYGDLQNTHAVMIYSNGVMTGIADGLSNQLFRVTYTNDQIASVRDEVNRTVQYQYSAGSLLTNVIDVLSNQTAYTYDAKGRLATVQKPDGILHIISRYDSGQVKSVLDTNGVGRLFEYSYDRTREQYYSAETYTSDGTVIESWYDGGTGSLLKRTRNGTVKYDSSVTQDDPYAPVTKEDAWGNVTNLVYPNGATVAREYRQIAIGGTQLSRMTKEVSETGVISLFAYDSLGNLTNKVEAAGTAQQREIRYAYNEHGLLLEQTVMDTNGQPYVTTEMQYDERGNLTNRVEAAGTAYARTMAYTYDVMGNLLTSGLITDNRILITASNTFDAAGRLLASWNALHVCTVSNIYNAAGQVETSYDALNRRTDSQYDSRGNATNIVVSLNGTSLARIARSYDFENRVTREEQFDSTGTSISTTVYTYDDLGNLLTKTLITDNRSLITRYQYDAQQRLIQTTDPDENVTTITYDPVTGKQLSVEGLGIRQEFGYDFAGNPTTVRVIADGKTNTVQAVYNKAGHLTAQTDAENRTQRMLYDALGQPTAQIDALNHTNTVSYSLLGQISQLTDAKDNVTKWDFSPLGQLLTKTYDDQSKVHYSYDAAGRLASSRDANGWYTTYAYDALGQLLTNSFYTATNGTLERQVVYTYDDTGRIQSYADGATTGTVVYDDVNNAQTVTVDYGGGNSMTSEYSYDPQTRQMTRVNGGMTNVYTYGADGKLQSVSIPGEGDVTYQYDQRGLNTEIQLPGGIRRVMEYDGFGQLVTNRVEDAANNEVLSQNYQRSLTGSIRTKTTDAGVWNYGYDLTGQLTNAALFAGSAPLRETSYSYDAMGNRIQESEVRDQESEITDYTANNLNQYTNISTSVDSVPSVVNLQYDLNGNLTNDGVRAYTWDTRNELTRVEPLSLTPSNGALKVTFSYDCMGRRIRKDVSVYQDSGFTNQASHIFFYDGWNLVKELITDNSEQVTATKSYVWGNDLSGSLQGAGGVGGLLAQITEASGLQPEVSFPCYDHNGNVEKIVNSSGAIVAEFQYDAFGNTISETISTGLTSSTFPFRFSTKYLDSEIYAAEGGAGLYYYGYRYYSPEQGRWINRDPLGTSGGANLYGFIGNRPVNAFDLLGLTNQPGDFGWKIYDPNFIKPGDGGWADCVTARKALLYARLAAAAYDPSLLPQGWRPAEKAIHSPSGLSVNPFKGPNGEIVIAFAGTDPTSIGDLITDGMQAFGAIGPQYVETRQLDDLAHKYPNATVVGHSLGGGEGAVYGTRHGMETITYNAAGIHDNTLLMFGVTPGQAQRLVTNYSVVGEPLTTTQILTGLPDALGKQKFLLPDLGDNGISPFLALDLHGIKGVIQALEKKMRDKGCCE